ncbi:MAG: hypothetical protein ACLS61_18865 [Ruminococcus sp.]
MHLYTEDQKEQGWLLFFHGSVQSVRFMIVVPGGLGIGFIFYMLSSDSSRIDLVDFRIDSWNPSCWWYYGNYLLQGFPEILFP